MLHSPIISGEAHSSMLTHSQVQARVDVLNFGHSSDIRRRNLWTAPKKERMVFDWCPHTRLRRNFKHFSGTHVHSIKIRMRITNVCDVSTLTNCESFKSSRKIRRTYSEVWSVECFFCCRPHTRPRGSEKQNKKTSPKTFKGAFPNCTRNIRANSENQVFAAANSRSSLTSFQCVYVLLYLWVHRVRHPLVFSVFVLPAAYTRPE